MDQSTSSSSSVGMEQQDGDAAVSSSIMTASATATTSAMTLPPSPPGEPAIRSPPPPSTNATNSSSSPSSSSLAASSSSSDSPSSPSTRPPLIPSASEIAAATPTASASTAARALHRKQPSGTHATDLHDDNDNVGKNGIHGSSGNSRIILNGVTSSGGNSSHNNSNEQNGHDTNHEQRRGSGSGSNNYYNSTTTFDHENNSNGNISRTNSTSNINNLQSPSRIIYTTTSTSSANANANAASTTQNTHPGRRSITLRLHELIDPTTTPSAQLPPSGSSNNNTTNNASFVHISSSPLILSSVRSLRRFRSLSLSGLPFAHVVNSAVEQVAEEENLKATTSASASTTTTTDGTTADGNELHPLISNNNTNGNGDKIIDRGSITVSWYEGTTSTEMSDHVYNCVLRKLNADRCSRRRKQEKNMSGEGAVCGQEKVEEEGKLKLEDVRLIDETVTPHGEVVLCPFLPDGSTFVLQFKTSIDNPPTPPPPPPPPPSATTSSTAPTAMISSHRATTMSSLPPWYASRAPESPSAEPRSPYLLNSHRSYNDYLLHQQSNNAVQHQQVQTQQLLGAVAALLQRQQQHSATSGGGGQSQMNGIGSLPTSTTTLPPVVPSISSVAEEDEEEEFTSPTKQLQLPLRYKEGDDNDNDKKVEEGDENMTTPMSSKSPIKMSNNALLATTLGTSTSADALDAIAEHATTTNTSSSPPLTSTALTTDQLIEQQLRQLNELFVLRKLASGFGQEGNVGMDVGGVGKSVNAAAAILPENDDDDQAFRAYYRAEKKQVIFVIANYFVLFLSLIALSAEIQSRLPQWMDWVQQNYDSVQNCATDQGALIECLSNGDFSGLVASFLLWATQSASAKRIFLFGFDTPKKLWTVVYEALVTAVCWGMSYLFIRRGLNPNTRQNFIQQYWKDAVYGSLAGFNAAFMKAVLKNLIPQEVALEALEGRQLRIRHWLLSLMED